VASETTLLTIVGCPNRPAIAGTGVGWVADHWGWGGVFTTMVACCLLTIFFSALTLGHQAQSEGRLPGGI